jgi:hypothetical protein
MEAGDILRLFYTDGTTSSFLVLRFDEDSVFLKSPAGDHVLHHSNGRLDPSFEGKTLAAFAHLHPEHKTFKIGQKVALTFGDEQVAGEVKEADDGLVGVQVNETLIYVDLVNPPKEFTSIREAEEVVADAPYAAVEGPCEPELFQNQLLHLYSKLLAEIPEHKQTFAEKRRLNGIVRRYKQLHEEFSTPNMLPKTYSVHLAVTPWICPIICPIKFLYDDVRVTDHTEPNSAWVDAFQTAKTRYESVAAGDRVSIYDRELAELFRPFENEGVPVPFQEGYALDVPVLHKTLRKKTVFVQHFAAKEKTKVEGYVFLPDLVPFSRIVLPQTPLLEKCVLHPGFLKYRHAVARLDRNRVHRLLQREPPLKTPALHVAAAVQALAPYGCDKDTVSFKEMENLAKQVEANVAAYKKLLKRGTLERAVRPAEKVKVSSAQERLFSKITAAAGELEELPPQAADLLNQFTALMAGGLTFENAATVAAFVELHGRDEEAWVYFRDPAIKTVKFVPAIVPVLARAFRDGTSAEVLDAYLHSGNVKVEDPFIVDRHSGYVLTRSTTLGRANAGADPVEPMYALSDLPAAAAFRTLCEHAAADLQAYEEYVVHRLRGVKDWVPMAAAFVSLLIEKEGLPYPHCKSMSATEFVAKTVAGFKTGVWPRTTEAAFKQKMDRLRIMLAKDYKITVAPPVKGTHVEWATFLPPKDGPVGNCDAVHENVDSSVKGRIFECSVQVALLNRKPKTAATVHRVGLVQNLAKRVRFPHAQLALVAATKDVEFADGSKPVVDGVVEEVPDVELAAALNHFEVQNLSKMGDKMAADTAIIRAHLKSRKKGVDFVADLMEGEWVGATSLPRVLMNSVQWVAANHDNRYMGSFTSDGDISEFSAELKHYHDVAELAPLDPRYVLLAKHACATRDLTLAKFALISVLALRGAAVCPFVQNLRRTLKTLNFRKGLKKNRVE